MYCPRAKGPREIHSDPEVISCILLKEPYINLFIAQDTFNTGTVFSVVNIDHFLVNINIELWSDNTAYVVK